MSLNRLWLFLAVALPVLAAVIAPMSTVDSHTSCVPVTRSSRACAADRRHLDVHRRRLAVGGPVVGRPGHPVPGPRPRRLDRSRGPAGGADRRHLRGPAAHRPASRPGRADGRAVRIAAFVVAAPAMGLRPQLFGMASFAVVLVLVAGRRDHPRALWLVPVVTILWANLHGSFFLAPVVLGLAWLEDLHDGVTPRHRTLVVAVVPLRCSGLPDAGRPLYGLGLRRQPIGQPGGHGAHLRVAADVHPDGGRPALLRLGGAGHPASSRGAGRSSPGRRWLWLADVRRRRPVCRARRRLVAACCRPGHRRVVGPGGRGPCPRRADHCNLLSQRRRDRSARPRRRRAAAGLATGGFSCGRALRTAC